ncbi:MAG: HU family DNA-binding protein [Gammaproteobacteria bacterium]|nr:HU family DNA-binding protein [Gammaproteobacteria bacterium]
MIKSQLIQVIAKAVPSLSEKNITLGVNQIIEKLSAALTEKKRIEIRGFGAFSVRFRNSTLARNPKTGEKVKTKAKYRVHFKPGKEMREKINLMYGAPIHTDNIEP